MLRVSGEDRKAPRSCPHGLERLGFWTGLRARTRLIAMTGSLLHALALWAALLGAGSSHDVGVRGEDAATRAMRHVSEGSQLRRSGQLFDACRHFRFAVGLTPTCPMARYELGRCLRLIGDPLGDAQGHLQSAHEGLPMRMGPLMELGRLAEDRQDTKGARTWYQAAVEVDPKSQEPVLALARLGSVGAGMASFEHARRLVRANGDDPAARRSFADASRDAGFKEQAREAYSWLLSQARPSWRAIAAEARLRAPAQRGTKVSDRASRRRAKRRRR